MDAHAVCCYRTLKLARNSAQQKCKNQQDFWASLHWTDAASCPHIWQSSYKLGCTTSSPDAATSAITGQILNKHLFRFPGEHAACAETKSVLWTDIRRAVQTLQGIWPDDRPAVMLTQTRIYFNATEMWHDIKTPGSGDAGVSALNVLDVTPAGFQRDQIKSSSTQMDYYVQAVWAAWCTKKLCFWQRRWAMQRKKYAHVENTNSVFPARLGSLEQTCST